MKNMIISDKISVQKTVEFCQKQGVKDIVLIGAVKRPTVFDIWPDWFTAKFFFKASVNSLGDNGHRRHAWCKRY